MNLSELSTLLDQATDVLRVETLDAYYSVSDGDMLDRYARGEAKPDPAEKQPWLDRLASAAQRGHPWRRLRVVSRPVPKYVRYACEFGYVDNVEYGEIVKVADEIYPGFKSTVGALRRFGDLLVLDGELVAMTYVRGRFQHAERRHPDTMTPGTERRILDAVENTFALADDFPQWWADNPDLHRNLATT